MSGPPEAGVISFLASEFPFSSMFQMLLGSARQVGLFLYALGLGSPDVAVAIRLLEPICSTKLRMDLGSAWTIEAFLKGCKLEIIKQDVVLSAVGNKL